jgi:hypothetical protein
MEVQKFAISSAVSDGLEPGVRAHSWIRVNDAPELRQATRDRRTEIVAFSRLVLAEALVRNELPDWIDADGIASAFVTLVDGFAVRAIDTGALSAEDARRDSYVLLELLISAPRQPPEALARLRAATGYRPS